MTVTGMMNMKNGKANEQLPVFPLSMIRFYETVNKSCRKSTIHFLHTFHVCAPSYSLRRHCIPVEFLRSLFKHLKMSIIAIKNISHKSAEKTSPAKQSGMCKNNHACLERTHGKSRQSMKIFSLLYAIPAFYKRHNII